MLQEGTLVASTHESARRIDVGSPIFDDRVVLPRSFARALASGQFDPYLTEPATAKLAEFFRAKGLAKLKEEDGREQWYQDWLNYQAKHQLYASVLSPTEFSSLGNQLDLLRLTRFLEVFAYFSPAHGYSLQVSFLGLFSILMGTNESLKREAIAALESGGLFALGVSEKDHGSDLISNEFTVTEITPSPAPGMSFTASGRKYYIGNSNCAAMISILARKIGLDIAHSPARQRRAPLVLVALRPAQSPGYRNIKKIRTLGVRAAFVGEFEVKDHPLPATDFIAEGRAAWDTVFGTVTLGKFFLGFGSIGMCEHAVEEAITHLHNRVLYRKSALEMPHIRLAMAQAYARLSAMKLFAFRALDYVQSASAADRRYLLYCAVQKARVGNEGVKVMSQLSECIGAKRFESENYFESALRDIQLIPGLEGSTHINLRLAAQFIEPYFEHYYPRWLIPKSLARGDLPASENPYLMRAFMGRINEIPFPHFLNAYKPLSALPNIRRFAKQAKGFARLARRCARLQTTEADGDDDTRMSICLGQCIATIAFAQLVAENATLFGIPSPMIAAMFHLLVTDLSASASALAALPDLDRCTRALARRLIAVPRTAESDWDFVAERMANLEGG
jgi:acyl-CoA dehydrogenase